MNSEDVDFTLLLDQARSGEKQATEVLYAQLHTALRDTAKRMMWNEKPGHTLQPTALVNEAMIRFMKSGLLEKAENRRFLFASASKTMRDILVDHARTRGAKRRPTSQERVSLDSILDTLRNRDNIEIEKLSDALEELREQFPRQAEVTELRFFSGLTEPEIAELLGIGVATVKRDWAKAKARLHLLMSGQDQSDE